MTICADSYSIFLLRVQINITRSFSRRQRVVRALERCQRGRIPWSSAA
jgi:hypothetical protein